MLLAVSRMRPSFERPCATCGIAISSAPPRPNGSSCLLTSSQRARRVTDGSFDPSTGTFVSIDTNVVSSPSSESIVGRTRMRRLACCFNLLSAFGESAAVPGMITSVSPLNGTRTTFLNSVRPLGSMPTP